MKKMLSFLLIPALILCLNGCSSYLEPEKTTISLVAAEYGPETAFWWLGFEKDFEAANPGLDLIVDVVSWDNIHAVVENRVAAGEAPDIVNIDVFAEYQAQGLLLPAASFASPGLLENLLPVFSAQSQVNGESWALPVVASARALYYNTDLLAQAGVEVPGTWSELEAAAQAIKDTFGGEIYPWGVDMTTNEGQACFAYYSWNNGGGFLDSQGNWALDQPENAEALEFVVGLVSKGLTNSDPAAETRYDLQDMFASGKLAMMIGPNQITSFIRASDSPVHFGVAPIPASDNSEIVCCGVVDRFLCFDNHYSPAEKAAISAFFDLFYQDQRYTDWVTMEDFLPVTVSGAELMSHADPAIGRWMRALDFCRFPPVSTPDWEKVKQGIIQVEQQALLGGDAQKLLTELQSQIENG